jgi:hypothetical protein
MVFFEDNILLTVGRECSAEALIFTLQTEIFFRNFFVLALAARLAANKVRQGME